MKHHPHIDRLTDALRDALLEFSPQSTLVAKPMFGGAGFYVDGYFMAAWYGDNSVALKLREADRAALLAVAGASQGLGSQYITVPTAWLDDPALLAIWVQKSLEYVRSLPQKKHR